MNGFHGFLLLIPFFAVRFGLLSALNKKALQRAAYFAPMKGKEVVAYYIYQISNIGMFLYLFFLKVPINFSWQFYFGSVCYLIGLLLCAISIVHFSVPDAAGLNTTGLYRFSRNPMYVAYFICFLGMSLLTQSLFLFMLLLIFQISAHRIILAEEKWCIKTFGADYEQYMKKVNRYI